METEWIEIECDFCRGEGYDEDSLTRKDGVNTANVCANCDGSGVIFELTIKSEQHGKSNI